MPVLLFLFMEKDWFRIKSYPHIGLPLKPKDRIWMEKYVKDENKIATHSFSPFLHKALVVRKFRRVVCLDGTRTKLRKPDKKIRQIFYADHLDANVYGYYASILNYNYNQKLKVAGIGDCVTAYRRIPVDAALPKGRNKCNIDFANEVFEFIRNNKTEELVAITFDVSSFFDNLDHKILKKAWISSMGFDSSMPADHYNVFKNITRFSYIDEKAIFEQYKDQIIVEKGIEKEIVKKKVVKRKYLREKNSVAYCLKGDLKVIRNSGLIRGNKYVQVNEKVCVQRNYGIPQGSPISSVLANIYLLEFDKIIYEYLSVKNGFYRRYSDDMVLLFNNLEVEQVIGFVKEKIQNFKLKIQDKKTQIFKFERVSDRLECYQWNPSTNQFNHNTVFEYLGFAFDGRNVFLKSSSLAGFYRKMKRHIRRAKYHSKHNKTIHGGEIFKSRLYKRFTFKGASRRRIYKRHPTLTNKWILTLKYDWGNYLSYATMAAKIIPSNKIAHQVKNHWRIFHEELKKKHYDLYSK